MGYEFWTYNGTVPGPMIRIRQGDSVELTLKNSLDSPVSHSIDSRGVTGPGGGGKVTQTPPGGTSVIRFNGSAGALSRENPLHAEVGEKARLFFGVAGPNTTSSVHISLAVDGQRPLTRAAMAIRGRSQCRESRCCGSGGVNNRITGKKG